MKNIDYTPRHLQNMQTKCTGIKYIEMQELRATLPFSLMLGCFISLLLRFKDVRGTGLCSVWVSRGLIGEQPSDRLAAADSCPRDRTASSILGGGLSLRNEAFEWH